MLSALESIFAVKSREAENTDTRLGIRRRREEEEGGRGRNQSNPEDRTAGGDQAVVSVEALRVFLENFIRSREENGAKPALPENAERRAGGPQVGTNARAARAAGAYRHAAETRPQNPQATETPPPQSGDLAGLLTGTEVREIQALLQDLQTLSANHIDHIRIERAETFLASLRNAVDAAVGTL